MSDKKEAVVIDEQQLLAKKIEDAAKAFNKAMKGAGLCSLIQSSFIIDPKF
jgi:hypothetical protein